MPSLSAELLETPNHESNGVFVVALSNNIY